MLFISLSEEDVSKENAFLLSSNTDNEFLEQKKLWMLTLCFPYEKPEISKFVTPM
jgi:hypothetical protein